MTTSYDFSDAVVVRKLTQQLSFAGVGIHPDRDILLFDLGNEASCSEEIQKLILEVAILHYEIDFAIASKADTIDVPHLKGEDNVYLVDHLSDELEAFLIHVARETITPEQVTLSDVAGFKKWVADSFKREGFTRDEKSRPGIFKITGSPNIPVKSCQDHHDR